MEPEHNSEELAVSFAFEGKLGEVLERHYKADRDQAVLSKTFRLYYLLRPFIPIPVRQWLQRSRNGHFEIDRDWFFPQSIFKEIRSALDLIGNMAVIHPWPDGKTFASCLTHDIETAQGQRLVPKVIDIEEKLGLRSAWYFISRKYKLDLGLIRELKERGHEVGIHGYNHDGRLFASRGIFQKRAAYINRMAAQLEAAGFRAPMVHRNLEWMQQLEVKHDASCFDIDPFQAMPGGVGGIWPFMAGKLVELPYTLPQDHTLFVTLGENTPASWIRKFNWIADMNGMALLITHPDYLDSDSRRQIYKQFCEHVVGNSQRWQALPSQIADWWLQRHNSTLTTDGTAGGHLISGPCDSRGRIMGLHDLFSSLLSNGTQCVGGSGVANVE